MLVGTNKKGITLSINKGQWFDSHRNLTAIGSKPKIHLWTTSKPELKTTGAPKAKRGSKVRVTTPIETLTLVDAKAICSRSTLDRIKARATREVGAFIRGKFASIEPRKIPDSFVRVGLNPFNDHGYVIADSRYTKDNGTPYIFNGSAYWDRDPIPSSNFAQVVFTVDGCWAQFS